MLDTSSRRHSPLARVETRGRKSSILKLKATASVTSGGVVKLKLPGTEPTETDPDELVPLTVIAKELGGVHPRTVRYWSERGLASFRIKRVGLRYYASRRAVEEFKRSLMKGEPTRV
jgi:hypothetical protein